MIYASAVLLITLIIIGQLLSKKVDYSVFKNYRSKLKLGNINSKTSFLLLSYTSPQLKIVDEILASNKVKANVHVILSGPNWFVESKKKLWNESVKIYKFEHSSSSKIGPPQDAFYVFNRKKMKIITEIEAYLKYEIKNDEIERR